MAEIISLSSGSDEDSDIEVVGVYNDTERKTETKPFIRGECIHIASCAPFVFDLKAHEWVLPPPRKCRRPNPSATVEVVDLSEENSLAEEAEGSMSPLSQGGQSQQLPALLRDEERELSDYPNSDGSQLERPSVENEDARRHVAVSQHDHTEEPYSRPEPPFAGAGAPPQPVNPSRSPDKADLPLDNSDFAIYDRQETELYPSMLSPYEWSPSSSPHARLKDATSSLCLDGVEGRWFRESISPLNHTGLQPLESLTQEAIPSNASKCCSPSLSPQPENDSPPLPPQHSQISPLLPQPHQSPPLHTSQPDSVKSHSELPLSSSYLAPPARGFPDEDPLEEQPPGSPLVVSDSSPQSHRLYNPSIPSDPPMSVARTEDLEQDLWPWRAPGAGQGDRSGLWLERSNEETGRGSAVADTGVSHEDRRYVCPVQLRKLKPLMAGPLRSLENVEEKNDGFGAPKQLCRQALSLVYGTMEESYPEGTLQLLSDLLHPRFYPPKDITSHLLRDILLDPRAPCSLRFQAFSLLMRTQRHHPAEKGTIPWDWELLTSVMSEQDSPRRHSSEAVCMLLQYTLQTLEDDFRVKLSQRDLPHSIAKATLSYNADGVSDVISWLLSSIVKSTGDGDSKERDNHLKMVLLLQKVLLLSLEVDCCPGVSAIKLARRLFHCCSSSLPLRQHRMLLLETLESRLLRCKLLELLLEQACPHTTSLPMSLALLLHFLKHCTLIPDPTDGADREQGWEELVQLLWMLLLSHEEVVRGHLHCPVTERGNSRPPVQVVNNTVSRSDVQEAVEDFLLRSQADLGRTLSLHVHESLTYLQDHLMDSCQS